jgi:hypothetical protein
MFLYQLVPIPTPPIKNFDDSPGGLLTFITALIYFALTMGGIYVLFNIILAGYQYLSASGDAAKIGQAHQKILYSIIGILVMAASMLITSIISWAVFGDPGYILHPRIFGPGP